MRQVVLSRVVPGMTLARPIHDARGDRLLGRDVELTPHLVSLLAGRGFMSVLVNDDLSRDIDVDEGVSERVRSITAARLAALYDCLDAAAQELRSLSPAAVTAGMASPSFSNALTRTHVFDTLWEGVDSIVDEVLEHANTRMLAESSACVQSHDDSSFGHAVDMTVVAVLIGQLVHMDRADLRRLAMGTLMSGTGSIFIDPGMFQHARRLTRRQRTFIEMHPAWGYELLRAAGWGDAIVHHVVYQHHERQDGNGYPQGLRGLNRVFRTPQEDLSGRHIILAAEIAAVADVYEALSSDRPWRRALPHNSVVETLRDMAGTHLNGEIVRTFLDVLPLFPPGMEVQLDGQGVDGCRALVIRVPEDAPGRPVVRVFRDWRGLPVSPFEIDLRAQPGIAVQEPGASRVPQAQAA